MGLSRKKPKKEVVKNILEDSVPFNVPLSLMKRSLAWMLFAPSLRQTSVLLFNKFYRSVRVSHFSNYEKVCIVEGVRYVLEEYLDHSNDDTDLLITHFIDKSEDSDLAESIINEISENLEQDSDYINDNFESYMCRYFSSRLKYAAIYKKETEITEIMNQIREDDELDHDEISEKMLELTQKMIREIKDSKALDEDSNSDFIMNQENAKNVFIDVRDKLNQPSSVIKTGHKVVNSMLDGGLHAGRSYIFMAVSGGGKSNSLLRCLKWYAEHNPDIKPTKPGLIPCALYVSQENTHTDTCGRIYSLAVPEIEAEGLEFKDMETNDLFERLTEKNWISDTNTIAIKYRRNKTIDTSDLDAMIDELEMEGYEVKILLHDYIKRIRPANSYNDPRLDYGEIVNEYCEIARHRHIPVCGAMQLNRKAIEKLEEAQRKGMDFSKKLGMQDVGESYAIIENADAAFIHHNEYYEPEGRYYYTLNRVKYRGNAKYPHDWVAIPYEHGSKIRLEEDFGTNDSTHRLSLSDGLSEHDVTDPSKSSEKPHQPVLTAGLGRRKLSNTNDAEITGMLGGGNDDEHQEDEKF